MILPETMWVRSVETLVAPMRSWAGLPLTMSTEMTQIATQKRCAADAAKSSMSPGA